MIFCNSCAFIKIFDDSRVPYECESNQIFVTTPTSSIRIMYRTYKRQQCEDKNKHNDCEEFKHYKTLTLWGRVKRWWRNF